jgi:hypothetical protein
MATGLVIMGAIYAVTEMGQRTSVAVERKIVAQQDARAALDIMALEIGMASCNPNFATGIWVDGPGPTCGNIAVHQTYRGIQEATANSITVEMDIRGAAAGSSPDGDVGDSNEMIRYNYDTVNQYITRRTGCGGGAYAFLGAQSGNPREVRVVNNTAGVPLFTYYDGAGTELVPVTDLPARIPDIRRIKITLVVETEAIDRSLNKRRRTICSTNTLVRNHAINF